jgi:hypothetical protein
MILKKLMLAAAISAPLLTTGAAHAANFDIRIGTPPPPPRVVAVPAARPGYVYSPGYWRWAGQRHVWVDGGYIRERRGYHYVEPAWDRDGERYGFRRGHWER